MDNVVVEVLFDVVVSNEHRSSYGFTVQVLCNQSSESEQVLISVKNDIDLSVGFEWCEAITQVCNLVVRFNFISTVFSLS